MKRPTTGQNIALSVTALVAAVMLLILLGVHLAPRAVPHQKGTEAIAMADAEPEPLEEDMFIEPIIADAGDPDITAHDQEAPSPQGEPEPAPEPNDKLVVNGPNPKENTESEPLVSTPRTSPVKTARPSPKESQDQQVKADVKNKFAAHNGKPDPKSKQTASSGTGTSGTGAAGTTKDGKRGLKSYAKPTGFNISKTIKVQVTLMVKADGTVKKGSARCNGLADFPALRQKLVACSETSKWDKAPDKNARDASATIVWTLVPGTK